LVANPQKKEQLKALVGQEFVYDVDELLKPQNVQYTNEVTV